MGEMLSTPGGNARGCRVYQPRRSAFSLPGQLSFRIQKFRGHALTACSAGSFHFFRANEPTCRGSGRWGGEREPDEVIHTGDTIGGCSLC